MLHRTAITDLEKWYKSTRRKPLVLRGARQIGKSTSVELFAKKVGVELITVNCEKHRQLDDAFKTLDIEYILTELEATAGKGAITNDKILFLDEIQTTPNALQALRYFYEERPELAVITAGSLLEFALSKHKFSMPVGRIQYLHMGPLTFREFVTSSEPQMIHYIDQIELEKPLPVAAHDKLLTLQRQYMFTGGMPEAISVFIETKSFSEVNEVHREIIETYIDDFSKYAQNKDLVLLQRVFSSVPRLLGQKIKYVNLAHGERAATVRAMIELLIKSQVVQPIWHSHCSGVPLEADIDDSVFKLSFLDVGLANYVCGINWQYISGLNEVQLVNEGGMAEQFVAQQLVRIDNRKPALTYWLREGRSSNAEVDFTIAIGQDIYPIEVKSGKSGSLKSLQQFILNKGTTTALRFDQNQASLQTIEQQVKTKDGSEPITYQLISLPLYGVQELPRLLHKVT